MYSIGTPFIFGWFLIFQYPSGHVYVMSTLPLTKSLTVSVCEAQKFRRLGATFFMVSAAAWISSVVSDVRVDRRAGVDEVRRS